MEIPEILIQKSIALPLVGLGTWTMQGESCTKAVKMALELGYRHFDTAHLYENHEAIRKGLEGFDREKLFLTSKFILSQLGLESVESSCDRALQELGSDYLDLYLLHYPDRSYDMVHVLDQMERLITQQKVRAIGVSNFTRRHLQDLLGHPFHISVNQVEFHPYLNQKELLAFCREHQIHLISYRSLGKGALITDPILEKIGEKYGKTAAQVSLRWLIEQNIPVIPKGRTKEHLKENRDIFDFALDAKDHAILDQLKVQHRFCDSEWADFNYR